MSIRTIANGDTLLGNHDEPLPLEIAAFTSVSSEEFDLDRTRLMFGGVLPPEVVDVLGEDELRQLQNNYPDLVWQNRQAIGDPEYYLVLVYTMARGTSPAKTANDLKITEEQMGLWIADKETRISRVITPEVLLTSLERGAPAAPAAGALSLGELIDGAAAADAAAEQPDSKEGPNLLNPKSVKKFLAKAYPDKDIDEYTQQEHLRAAEELIRIMKDHPEHFQRSVTPFNSKAIAERLTGILRGINYNDHADQLGISKAALYHSAVTATRLANTCLPLDQLTGRQELILRKPVYEELARGGARSTAKTNSGKNFSGPTSPNTNKALANMKNLREFAGRHEIALPPYEGLFDKEEMRILALMCCGVKANDLDRVMKLTSGHARRFRTTLAEKLKLPDSGSYGVMTYIAAAYQITTIKVDFPPAASGLTRLEKDAFRLSAQGITNTEVSASLKVSLAEAKKLVADAKEQLIVPGDIKWANAILALGHNLLPYPSTGEQADLAKSIKGVQAKHGKKFAQTKPLTLEDLTEKVTEEVRPDGVYRVVKLRNAEQYHTQRRATGSTPEEIRKIAAFIKDGDRSDQMDSPTSQNSQKEIPGDY